MKHHKNQCEHNPPHSYGDCHRSCVATILGLDPSEVPHFYDGCEPNTEEGATLGAARIEAFLRERNLREAHVLYSGDTPLSTVLEVTADMCKDVAFILGGQTHRNGGHSVVVMNGEIINDPTEGGIIRPMPDGYWWTTYFVVAPDYFAPKED